MSGVTQQLFLCILWKKSDWVTWKSWEGVWAVLVHKTEECLLQVAFRPEFELLLLCFISADLSWLVKWALQGALFHNEMLGAGGWFCFNEGKILLAKRMGSEGEIVGLGADLVTNLLRWVPGSGFHLHCCTVMTSVFVCFFFFPLVGLRLLLDYNNQIPKQSVTSKWVSLVTETTWYSLTRSFVWTNLVFQLF